MCVMNEEDRNASLSGAVLPAWRARTLGVLLGMAMTGAAAGSAQAESRTISMYHIHTKERITITYWKDGRFIPSALRKLNWFLRDWRKNKAVRMDPRTIDLIWKLHADLGSKEPVHIICGHRSAATNAMLRRIGRRVARRSRHITGQAIDFKFPDVPTWKVRNLALAYGIGGVGYYGRNGFVHVDTGTVRHWPRLPQYKLARIVRDYRRLIGRGWKRGNDYIMLARAKSRRANFNRPAATSARKKGEVLLARASGKGVKQAGKPIALPGIKPALLASAEKRAGKSATAPTPRPRPYQVLVLAASRMEVTPVSAPATLTNFAGQGTVRDPIGVVIASLPDEAVSPQALEAEARAEAAARPWPKVMRAGKGDLAVALLNGEARDVPTLENVALRGSVAPAGVVRQGKGDLLTLGLTPRQLARRDGAPVLEAGATQQAGMFWPGMRVRVVPDRKNRPQRVNRSGKGDLLTVARVPENVRKAALEGGALDAGDLRPISFR